MWTRLPHNQLKSENNAGLKKLANEFPKLATANIVCT